MTAFLMLAHQYCAFDRIPVGVDIEGRHEDRYLQLLLVEILVLFGRLYHYHATVCRRDDEVRIVDLDHTHRVAEEIGDEDQQHRRQDQRDGEDPMRLHKQIDGDIDDKKEQYGTHDQSASFSVYSWCFHMLIAIVRRGIGRASRLPGQVPFAVFSPASS